MPSGSCSRIAAAGVEPGHDRDPAAGLDQVAGDVPLHAEVERDDVRPPASARSAEPASPAWRQSRLVEARLPGDAPRRA